MERPDQKRFLLSLKRSARPDRESNPRSAMGFCVGLLMISTSLLLPLGTLAQLTIPPLPEGHIFQIWDREDGLPQISVLALAQDTDGFLWLGTEDGLVRFDGIEMKVFDRDNTPELRSQYINELLAPPDGGLWIGTEEGLVRLKDGRFEAFDQSDGLRNDFTRSLHLDVEGRLWIGTVGGLSRFDGNSFHSFTTDQGLPHDAVFAVTDDGAEGLWAGTENGLAHLDARGRVDALDLALPHPSVTALLHDSRGRLWIGTHQGLAYFQDGQLTSFASPAPTSQGSAARELADAVISDFFEDRQGDVWVGTDGRGLFRFRSGEWTAFRRRDGLPHDTIRGVIEDHEGNLWIGTYLGGLGRMRTSAISVFGDLEGLVDNIAWTVYQDRSERVWVGTNGGLTCIRRDGSSRSFTTADGLPENDVRTVFEDRQGRVWIGTTRGLARFDKPDELDPRFLNPFPLHPDIDRATIRSVTDSTDGSLWISTLGTGLHRIGPELAVESWTAKNGLPSNEIRAFLEDSAGIFWIGTSNGLVEARNGVILKRPEPSLRVQIFALHEDLQGAIWVGVTSGRVSRIQDGEVTTFGAAQGLPDHRIHSVLTDRKGDLWVTHNDGIYRVVRDQLDRVANGSLQTLEITAFDESHGMRSSECNGLGRPASLETLDGRLWFTCIGGAAVLNPAVRVRNDVPPAVHILEVSADQQTLDSNRPAELPSNTREIEFRFAALSYQAPERNRYRYRLEGFDEQWVEGKERSARYTNLDPGAYGFRLVAANNDGVWNEHGDTFEFSIRPAFYQTGIFLVGCVLLAGLGVRFFHRRRMRRVLRRRLKSNKVEMLEAQIVEMERFTYAVSHDLKSPLVTIRSFADDAAHGLKSQSTDATVDVHKVTEDLHTIELAADKMQQMLDELLELSRSGRVVAEEEEIPLHELAREVVGLISGRIQSAGAEVVISDELPTVRADRRRLRQAFQNLIDNAVKFSATQETPRVEIGRRGDPNQPIFFVRDNGSGIPLNQLEKIFQTFHRLNPKVEGTGMGLALVRRVIEAHGGTIWAESDGPGHGATFCFTLPDRQVALL